MAESTFDQHTIDMDYPRDPCYDHNSYGCCYDENDDPYASFAFECARLSLSIIGLIAVGAVVATAASYLAVRRAVLPYLLK